MAGGKGYSSKKRPVSRIAQQVQNAKSKLKRKAKKK